MTMDDCSIWVTMTHVVITKVQRSKYDDDSMMNNSEEDAVLGAMMIISLNS